jgi:hypothetical protein
LFRKRVVNELAMVIAIDAVRYSWELETTESGRTAVADGVAEGVQRQDSEVMAPARGVMCGLLLGGVLWVGLVAGARALLMMMR